MMSERLQNFIRDNQADFDDLEPGHDLWEKIEKRIPEKKQRTFSLGFVLRLAALLILVMSVSFIFYLRQQKQYSKIDLAEINPVYARQQVHYASLIENKRKELKYIAQEDPQLYKEFTAEISKMDSVYQKLNRDLSTTPNQDRVLRAMIRNLQIQTEVLNQQLNIIEQFNQMKKEQHHETKNI